MMFPHNILLVILMSSSHLMVRAFQLFDELDVTVTEANTTYMKSETRAPDLYVQLNVAAQKPDGSSRGREVLFSKTLMKKKQQNPTFNQHFTYVRLERMRYTFGTDNIIIIRLFDQAMGYDEDIVLAEFDVNLQDVVNQNKSRVYEQVVTVKNETLSITSSVGYKIHFLLHHVDQPLPLDAREDDYEADESESPLFHVHRIRHEDGSVEVVPPDYSFIFDLKNL